MSQRFEGRNLDDALGHAAEALGVERWQLTYHVLTEKRGFLGGVKRIVIEADVNSEAPPPAPEPASASTAVPRSPRERRPSRGARGGHPRGAHQEQRGDGRRGRRRGRGEEFQGRDVEVFVGDLPEQGAESESVKTVREWCENLLRLAKLDLVLRTEENESQIIVRIYGSDSRQLTERHGELLDAIQVLANKAFIGRSIEKDIELDCEEFKSRRAVDLEQRARDAADRVRRSGGEELLPTMAPIERRIVHLALQDDAEVMTESRGEGFYKRVAIVRRPASSQGAEAANAQEP